MTQIWVATGTYYPDEINGTDTDNRNSSFVMKNNLAIYGGFAGSETQLSQRNMAANETILSGDIDQDDTFGGNSYTIVRNNQTNLNSTAILDGFTIIAANSDGNSSQPNETQNGGGIFNLSSSPLFRNCTIKNNTTIFRGCLLYTSDAADE